MGKLHNSFHQFSAGLNTLQNPLSLPFEHPLQNEWKVYYEGITIGATYPEIADAYYIGVPNGGGTLVVGGEQSMTFTGDGSVFSGYSLLTGLADIQLAGANKKFYLETSLKLTATSVPDNGLFVGYSDAAEALTTGVVDAIDGVTDAIGFGQVSQDTEIAFYSRDGSVTQEIGLGAPFVTGVYTTLQCYYDGTRFNLYRDNVPLSSTAKTKLNVDTPMTPQVFFEAVNAAANTLDIQYLLLAVEL